MRKIVGKFLTRQQLAALLKAAEQSDNTDLPEIIKVMGATGLRRENVLAMRWEWFGSERATLSVPAEADKAKKGFVLHLSSGVLEILRRRQRQGSLLEPPYTLILLTLTGAGGLSRSSREMLSNAYWRFLMV